MRLSTLLFAIWLAGVLHSAAAPADLTHLPTIFLIGDSTMRNGRGDGAGELWGWGDFLSNHFDAAKVTIKNRALGGRSSRTFLTEGLWEKTRADLQPGDFVIIQFGHNDAGELAASDRPRGSLRGNGEEVRQVVVEKTGLPETVHTYGWYLRKFIADTKAARATPIVLSQVPRNIWQNGKVPRASANYGRWAREAAATAGAQFLDANELIAGLYEQIGQAKVAEFFTEKDHTHTTRAGAIYTAEIIAANLPKLPRFPFAPVRIGSVTPLKPQPASPSRN